MGVSVVQSQTDCEKTVASLLNSHHFCCVWIVEVCKNVIKEATWHGVRGCSRLLMVSSNLSDTARKDKRSVCI